MKTFKDILTISVISAIVLFTGLALIEADYKNELLKMGWLPKDKTNSYTYGRRISGYRVSENTPNFRFSAFDENFSPVTMNTDSNGFLTDGTILRKEKDSNTVRIFIVGGSTAWGSIESHETMKDTTYPEGSYCYNATIAGKLKKILNVKYPQFNFEIIDAAVVYYCFHQNFALYFEKLHDFDPDIVINIDGQNDMEYFWEVKNNGDPYPGSMDQMEEELELATMSRLPQWPYTLAYYNYKYVRQQGKLVEKRKSSFKAVSHVNSIINHDPSFESYEMLRKNFNISKKIIWLINSYESQLRFDKVYSIFCLQPILQRRIYQKELSPIELKFRSFLDKVTVADTLKIMEAINHSGKSIPIELVDKIHQSIGIDFYWIRDLKRSHLFNDLSPVFDSIVTTNGGSYIDVNKAMKGMGSDKEFYVDYCHLTPFGNEFVADLISKKVEIFLSQKKIR